MRTTIFAVALAACASGCFGAQYIGMIVDHKSNPDGGADDVCKDSHEGTPNGSLCDALFGHEISHTETLPPALRDAIAFFATGAVHDQVQGNQLGVAYVRASELDLGAVDAAMKEAGVDPRLAEAFARHLRAYGKAVVAAGDADGASWKAVYVTPAVDAGAAWDAGVARRAPWNQKLAALAKRDDAVGVSGKKDAKLLDDLIALQRGYVAACRGAGVALEECLGDEIGRPVTRRIVRLAWASGDHYLAQSEHALFAVPDVSARALAVRVAARAAEAAGKADRAAWEKAKAAGRSDDALRARWPIEPVDVDRYGGDLAGADPAPKADDVIDDDNDQHWMATDRAVVASVARKGARTVLTFKRDVDSYGASYDCRDTNKVESIDDEGRLHYEQKCDIPVAGGSVDNTHAPIVVPAEEAAPIHANELVTFVEDDHHRGHVLEVHGGDAKMKGTLMSDDDVGTPLLQLGEYRLEAHAEAKAAKKPRH